MGKFQKTRSHVIAAAREKIEAARLSGAEELSLSDMGMNKKELNAVATQIGEISTLTRLDLSKNNLSALPKSLYRLHLTNLDVSDNKFKSLPKEIGKLKSSLKYLDVSLNKLKSLPKELCKLEKLTHLFVFCNELKSLPNEINKLEGLSLLNAYNNKLESLPKNIGKLGGLTKLSVQNNRLKAVPDELSNLTNLVDLRLGFNQLKSVPDVSGMKELKQLLVYKNELTGLPEGMENLSKLTHLYAGYNQLTSLEPLSNLRNLVYIAVADNRLTTLPQSFSSLPGLQTLLVDGNPLTPDMRSWLNQSFPGHVHVSHDRNNPPRPLSSREVLNALYRDDPEQGRKMLASLENCDLGQVTLGTGEKQKDAKDAIKEFLSKTIRTDQELEQYGATVRGLTEGVLDPDIPREQRKDNLAILATCLGDCRTPVFAFVLREWVNQRTTESGALSEKDLCILEREALRNRATRFKNLMPGDAERAEELEGLMNIYYMQGVENNPGNVAMRIKGDRERLPSVTAYSELGFHKVAINPELIKELGCLICETDDQGMPLKNEDGSYQQSREKIKVIFDRYIVDQGLGHVLAMGNDQGEQEERERREEYIERYSGDLLSIFEASDAEHLYSNFLDDADVTAVLNTNSGDELRLRLVRDAREGIDVAQTYNQYLDEKRSIINALVQRYPSGNNAVQELVASAGPASADAMEHLPQVPIVQGDASRTASLHAQVQTAINPTVFNSLSGAALQSVSAGPALSPAGSVSTDNPADTQSQVSGVRPMVAVQRPAINASMDNHPGSIPGQAPGAAKPSAAVRKAPPPTPLKKNGGPVQGGVRSAADVQRPAAVNASVNNLADIPQAHAQQGAAPAQAVRSTPPGQAPGTVKPSAVVRKTPPPPTPPKKNAGPVQGGVRSTADIQHPAAVNASVNNLADIPQAHAQGAAPAQAVRSTPPGQIPGAVKPLAVVRKAPPPTPLEKNAGPVQRDVRSTADPQRQASGATEKVAPAPPPKSPNKKQTDGLEKLTVSTIVSIRDRQNIPPGKNVKELMSKFRHQEPKTSLRMR